MMLAIFIDEKRKRLESTTNSIKAILERAQEGFAY